MGNIIWLVVLEIIALTFWVIGYSCTKGKTSFPNTELGYKTTKGVLNRNTWDYSNEFAGKLANVLGTVLFVLNAVAILVLDITWPMLIVNILCYLVLHTSITKALDKRFTDTGKIIKGI